MLHAHLEIETAEPVAALHEIAAAAGDGVHLLGCDYGAGVLRLHLGGALWTLNKAMLAAVPRGRWAH